MQRSTRLALAVVLAAAVLSPPASANPPKRALIREGRSMAGVRPGQSAPRSAEGTRILAPPMSNWGPLGGGGYCYEGSECSWKVSGGGGVTVIRGATSGKVWRVVTTAPGWRTRRGAGPGMGVAGLRRRYGSRIRFVHTCLGDLGGEQFGYELPPRGRRGFTVFETNRRATRVRAVWIGKGRIPIVTAPC